MTLEKLTPGCFGSVVFFNVNAPECNKCASFETCGEVVKIRRLEALKVVAGLDIKFKTDSLTELAKRFKAVFKVAQPTVDEDTERAQSLLTTWSDMGINVYLLKHGLNPCDDKNPLLKELFAFMLETKFFKARDVVEHLQSVTDETKSYLTRYVKVVADTLKVAKILQLEGRGILCLR